MAGSLPDQRTGTLNENETAYSPAYRYGLLEARVAGLRPVTMSHKAATLEQTLDSTLGRLGERKTNDTSGHRIRPQEEDG